MSELIVVDLASQATAVRSHVLGWSVDQIVTWLSQYGEVHKIPSPYDDNLFSFRSAAGCHAGFRLEQGGKLAILGDNTIDSGDADKRSGANSANT